METPRTHDLLAIADLVRDGRATSRGMIGRQLGLRSTTVSDLVGQLVARDVLHESTLRSRSKGRPAAVLSFNAHRLGAVFVTVIDQTLVACAVDLNLRVIGTLSAAPPHLSDNDALIAALRRLVADTAALFPPETELCAIVCSLSGLLDVPRSTWCVSSRWPNMRNLDLGQALAEFACRVWLIRNLDAELAGLRLYERHGAEETALLLHWGHGIGAAFAAGGDVVNRNRGRSCEIGHWRLGNGQNRQCTCGNTDCLETVAALWSIGPKLAQDFPGLPQSEREIAAHLGHADLLDSTVVRKALSEMLRLTANLCRLLFPDRVILTGPFVQNPDIFGRFVEALSDAPILRSLDKVRVSVGDGHLAPEIAGALSEPFAQALADMVSCDGKVRPMP